MAAFSQHSMFTLGARWPIPYDGSSGVVIDCCKAKVFFKYGAHMHAYEAIHTIETDLRTLVRLILGDNWLAVSGLDRTVLEERRQTERQRRPAAAVDQDLLAYTELTQLQNLILARAWEQFAPALGTRAHMKTYLSKISAYRNPTMHSRLLLPFEEHLVLGISGEIRNQIALYRKEREEARMFYPTIEQVTDSFGHAAVGPAGDAGTSGVRLEVGDQVTFKCRAYDQQQRELTWRLNAGGVDVDTGVGEEVTLTWKITTADVGESRLIHVIVKSTGPYHRISPDWGDDYVYFHYPVNPPR